MARISEEELERLKSEISVQRLAEARGVKLKKHGKDLLGLCPFHDDREPSLVVTPSKNLWHCLGACQTGGGPIDWVMKAQGVSFRHAAELLRADHPSLAAPRRSKLRPKLEVFAEPGEADEVVLRRVVEFYHQTLKQSEEAQSYLESRGLKDGALIEHFKLGYANRTLAYRLPHKHLKEGRALREQLQRLGVFRLSGHEHLNGSLTIPVFDGEGAVVELYGRKVRNDLRPGTPLHLYLPGPHRGVFNLDGVRGAREVILCEALVDALSFWQAGYRNVTSAYGIEGFTGEHLEVFQREGVRTVLIAYDRDEAGDRAAAKLAEKLGAAGIGSYRVKFPKGLDANEYARMSKPVAKQLELVLRQAEWLGPGRPKASPGSRGTDPGDPAPASSLAADGASAQQEAAGAAAPAPAARPAGRAAAAAAAAPASSSAAAAPVVREPVGAAEVEAEVTEEQVVLRFGPRRWRVRGLDKNHSYEQLRVNLLVSAGEAYHVDNLELYSARQREAFLKAAAQELEVEPRVLKRDLGQVLRKLEALQDAQIRARLAPSEPKPSMSEAERDEALSLLKDPALLERILRDYERCGVVGERTNKLVGYLAAVSRKLEAPLAVVIQSSSAAGKSSLMEAVLRFIPEEERVSYSAMTGQSLFYMGETDLAHKVLSIAEEEGASNASYALKLLQSEGELTIASTGKDPASGRLVTQEYRVQGPVMIFLTTTALEVDEELLNRCIVLTVDEGREQTRAIHALQRKRQTLEGLLAQQDVGGILKLHQNAQRLLRPLLVANPFAEQLRFLDHQTRTRRDHMKYLTLIRSIALLHQYQREEKTVRHDGREVRYIEVTEQDIALANELAEDVLGRSMDALPPQTRRLYALVREMVYARAERLGLEVEDVRFSRRDVREHCGWGHTQLKVHLSRLVELELLLVHRGHHSQRHFYELSWPEPPPGAVVEGDRSGGGRGPVGPPPRPVLSKGSGAVAKPVGVNGQSRRGSLAPSLSYTKVDAV